jgi:murein peptide amidase A
MKTPLADTIKGLGPSPELDDEPSRNSFFANSIVAGLRHIPGAAFEVIGEVADDRRKYPQLAITISTKSVDPKPWLLLSGGVHGDEPAGVAAIFHFLRDFLPVYSERANFVVLPCVNPTGFVAGTANSYQGMNLNREFSDRGVAEVKHVMKWLGANPRRYCMTFDFHEIPQQWEGEGFVAADNPKGCYLYETQQDHRLRIGRRMTDAVSEYVAVCDWSSIYGDVNDHGVVWYPEACRNPIYAQGTSFDSYLQRRYTDHSFTTETPTIWPLRERAATHLVWLMTAIDSLAETNENAERNGNVCGS